tara:strand:+ start:8601 stop:9632 length:1032 start_codon:yes stop_codon:yes gene_type:complete
MLLSKRYKQNFKPHIKLNKIQKKNINKFIDDLNKNRFKSSEKLSCLICKNYKFEVISEKDRYGLSYTTGICEQCGNLQQIEYYSDDALNHFYRSFYNKIYFNFIDPKKRFESQFKLASDKFIFLSDYLKNIKDKNKFRILEIGCGPGGILKYFKNKGFSVTGLDLDEEHLNYGKSQKLNLINKFNFESNYKFDLIIISHVLEHMKNPEIEIDIIKNYAHKNTLLYIEVPSIHTIDNMYDSDFLKYLHIAHCYHFSLNSFKNFCIKKNLSILKINKKIQALCKVSIVCEEIKYHYNETREEIQNIEKKYLKFGKFLILKRLIRRFVGRILNKLGIKFYILNLFK